MSANRGVPHHFVRGTASPKRKLSDDQVRAIRASTGSPKVVGKEYGVSHMTVLRIREGVTYREVTV